MTQSKRSRTDRNPSKRNSSSHPSKNKGASASSAKASAKNKSGAPTKLSTKSQNKDSRSKKVTSPKSTPTRVKEELRAASGCAFCETPLKVDDRALFVEEEVGRVFCSEKCILEHFTPDIERLEDEYYKYLSKDDLPQSEKEKLAHLRQTTLEDPEEIWREKTVGGDYRYFLVSEYSYKKKSIWCVCVCLFLKGEPSFLFMSFVTKVPEFVNRYRRGERMTRFRSPAPHAEAVPTATESEMDQQTAALEGLASDWTEEDSLRADLVQNRNPEDISVEDFEAYQDCVEPTLQEPDEVWSRVGRSSGEDRTVYTFIKNYYQQSPRYWFVIIAKETEDRDQLEILEAFPTRDEDLLNRFRVGKQEIGGDSTSEEETSSNRILH